VRWKSRWVVAARIPSQPHAGEGGEDRSNADIDLLEIGEGDRNLDRRRHGNLSVPVGLGQRRVGHPFEGELTADAGAAVEHAALDVVE